MFAKISYTWSIMRASWDVLKRDKTLLLFPLLSGLCCLLVLLSFLVPIFLTGAWQPPAPGTARVDTSVYYGILLLFYLANFFVITFFNTAIISCAMLRLAGGSPTLADGFHEAAVRLPQIAGWALLSATVGLILRIIEDRSKWIGRIVAGLLGMAWTVTSFLVVPVIVAERKGPFGALKGSTVMLRRTWGEQLVGSFSFGVVFGLLGLPAVALIVAVAFLGNLALLLLAVLVGVVYWIALSLVQSALQSIFQAAVYLYSYNGGLAPEGFSPQLLADALRPK
ncbi:MAG TPA: DUF6159 family protein [Verrucomicrobiae bacterium]|nr:DUF6159 family protein [Verrucomicrobiae bacterium]